MWRLMPAPSVLTLCFKKACLSEPIWVGTCSILEMSILTRKCCRWGNKAALVGKLAAWTM